MKLLTCPGLLNRAARGALLALVGGLLPALAAAQVDLTSVAGKKAVGIGVFYAMGALTVDGAPANATPEIKGYTEILPTVIDGAGPGIGLSFADWGVVFGVDDNTLDINRSADVNGTPANPLDDVFVYSARRVNTSVTMVWQPYRWWYVGLGRDSGSVAFDQLNASGTRAIHKISYENDFYTVGLGIGFDPRRSKVAPVLTVFTKHPMSPGAFTGVTNAVGLGIYF
jgi:hypothetical protein